MYLGVELLERGACASSVLVGNTKLFSNMVVQFTLALVVLYVLPVLMSLFTFESLTTSNF